ncbi:amino acid transporter [Halenospora varia]|nr:amino acid transporter [Halenospora varia]
MGDAVKDLTCGSVAGILGKFIEYPFDTIKVRLQSQPVNRTRLYSGPIDCFRQSLARDGWRSLYRGISAPLASAAVENSSLFFGFQACQEALYHTGVYSRQQNGGKLPIEALVACGAAAGAFTSLLLTPVELVKCKMQVPADAVYPPRIASLIKQIYRQHGLFGFWHGQLGTFIRETGGGAAWFGTYEYLIHVFKQSNTASRTGTSTGLSEGAQVALSLPQQLLAGASAGLTYNFLFYPADTIKSRLQTEALPLSPPPLMAKYPHVSRRTFAAEGMFIWKQQGLAGFYRGCGITLFRSAPSSALIFAVYEWLRAQLD